MKLISPLIAATLAVCPHMAAQPQIQGPVSGLIYESASHSIRPILGLAGGAHLGTATYSGLDYASIAPDGHTALVVASGSVALIRDARSATQASPQALDGTISGPNHILWAADSSAAVLVAPRLPRIQRLANLQGTPAVEAPINLAVSLNTRLLSVAADPTARKVVAGVRNTTGGALLYVSESGDVGRLGPIADPSAAAFSADGRDVYAADRTAQQVVLFRNAAPGTSGTPVLDTSNGIADPVGLAVSGQQLLVVSAAQQTVQTYALPSISPAGVFRLEGEPQGIEAVAGSSFFRLTFPQNPGDTLWMFDAHHQPSLFFVPAGQ
jgi:hypothetical protein